MRQLSRRFSKILTKANSPDLLLLINLLMCVIGVWSFALIASEMQEGETQAFDAWAVKALRQPGNLAQPVGPGWLVEVARDITSFGGGALLIILSSIVVGFLCLKRNFRAAAFLFAVLIGGTLLDVSLKLWFARPRPTLVPRLTSFSSDSFPSGHSMLSTIAYLSIGVVLARMMEGRNAKIYFLAVGAGIAFAVGLSRIYLGVHYPTDVLAGWLAGLTWAIVCNLAAQHLQRRRDVEPPNVEQPRNN